MARGFGPEYIEMARPARLHVVPVYKATFY